MVFVHKHFPFNYLKIACLFLGMNNNKVGWGEFSWNRIVCDHPS